MGNLEWIGKNVEGVVIETNKRDGYGHTTASNF